MKKYILLILTAFALTSCNLDFFPYDKVSSGSMQNVENAGIATDGNYALFKAALDYGGFFTVGNTYVRHYFQLNEYKGDNTLMSGKSTDPLFLDATLDDSQHVRRFQQQFGKLDTHAPTSRKLAGRAVEVRAFEAQTE